MAVLLTVGVADSTAAAQDCSCQDAFVADTIVDADGVFIGIITALDYGDGDGEVVTTASPPKRTSYDVSLWVKGSPDATTIDVDRGGCGGQLAELGDEVAVAFDVTAEGRAVRTCAMPPPSVVRALAEPEPAAPGPAVYFATSPFAPPLLLDADARIVASDPNTANRRIEAAVGCGDGTVAYLQDREVVIVDADFIEVERLEFRRTTDELFCPEPGVVLAIAGPAQERQVYDVRSRAPISSQLTFGSPADAVGDLVAGAMENPGDANPTVRVVSRSSGVERTLIDPALLVGGRPVTIASVRLSPSADRVAFSVTSGPEEDQLTTVMVADTAGGSILALAEVGSRRSHVRWLSPDRILVQATTGQSTLHAASNLAVERALEARWIQHLDGDVLSGIGDSQRGGPGVGTTLTRLILPSGEPGVEGQLPFEVRAIRLPDALRAGTTGKAFVEPLGLPLPSEGLDTLVATPSADGIVFVQPDQVSAATPPSTDDTEASAPIATPASDGEDAGILMWAVAAGAVTIGGVVLMLARRPQARR